MDAFDGLLRQALIVIAVIVLPILAVATTVGTLVALLQAATQIQEQTLTLLPKIVAVSIALALFGGFGLHLCEALFHEAIARLPAIVAGR
jgi:flagellar biosynthetic protein FliQ